MTDFRGTGFFFNEYGGECNKFGWSSAHAFRFPGASGNWDDGNKIIFYVRWRKVQVITRVSMTLFVSANTHQGAECFNTESRGKQCAFMSLSAILTAERIPLFEWSQSTIDNILVQGDFMYVKALNNCLLV